MTEPIPHPDEQRRLEALHALAILDTPPEERFDRLTRLACRHFRVPVSLITLVDADRQWFKSAVGLDFRETPRRLSFCGHAILTPETMVVQDARRDRRFSSNPMVSGSPGIVFYAGHPLRAPDGWPVGTFCIIDYRPRRFDRASLADLADFAALAEDELSVLRLGQAQLELTREVDRLREKAMVDGLTRIWNRTAILEILQRELARGARQGSSLGVSMLDLDHFKRVNDEFGHQKGDEVLKEVAHRVRDSIRPYDAVGRYGGEEFLIVLPGCSLAQATDHAERIRKALEKRPVQGLTVTGSLGVTAWEGPDGDPGELVAAADTALYRAKAKGRNRVEVQLPSE